MDRAWYAASQALVRDHREALAAVLDHLTRQGGATSVRCVEGVYVYAAYPDIPAAERVAGIGAAAPPSRRWSPAGRSISFHRGSTRGPLSAGRWSGSARSG